jgi:GT2 family glycosyltransferase
MKKNPLVSVIVVNHNGARHLEICLPSLLSQSYRPIEIIVVDNGSTDDSAMVASRFDVRWLAIGRNIGLAPALNRGAQQAAGELLLFLNNDMRFHERFTGSMVEELLRNPEVFAVDALQYNWEGDRQVHLVSRLTRTRPKKNSYDQLAPGLFVCQTSEDRPSAALMASAASMLARKSMFQVLGGFDERMPLCYEDVDLCWRAWARGWKTVFSPLAVCWHRVGAGTRSGEGAHIRLRGTLVGRLVLGTKLFPVRFATLAWLALAAGLARDLAGWRWRAAAGRSRVLVQCISHLPGLVTERLRIYRSARTTPNELLQRLLRLHEDAWPNDSKFTIAPFNSSPRVKTIGAD